MDIKCEYEYQLRFVTMSVASCDMRFHGAVCTRTMDAEIVNVIRNNLPRQRRNKPTHHTWKPFYAGRAGFPPRSSNERQNQWPKQPHNPPATPAGLRLKLALKSTKVNHGLGFKRMCRGFSNENQLWNVHNGKRTDPEAYMQVAKLFVLDDRVSQRECWIGGHMSQGKNTVLNR